MRAVLVIFGVLVVVELGSQLPLTHAAIGAAQHPGGAVTLGSLLVGLVLCLPIVGFFRLFRFLPKSNQSLKTTSRAAIRR